MTKKMIVRRVLIVTGAVLVVTFLGLYLSALLVVNGIFSHRVEKFEYTPEELNLAAQTIDLTSSDGIHMKAWWAPVKDARGVVVLLHGMDGQDASSLLPHAVFLNQAGYATLTLDMRAHGRSSGKRIGLAFEEPRDATAALDWIRAQPELKDKPVALLGLSMGGAVAIRTAAQRPDVTAVISVSAFASVDRVINQAMRLMGAPDTIISPYSVFIRMALATLYGVWPSMASPVRDIARISPRPVLIIHGTADSQIPVENAYLLAEAGGGRVESWIVPGAEHLVFTGNGLDPQDAPYRERILAFLREALK
ncbi:MAG: alpha/beta hydrolase [Anaerolineaceae bacterium]|nr:alpha/beta hydrolase [Anaerolineaceae bacterium]